MSSYFYQQYYETYNNFFITFTGIERLLIIDVFSLGAIIFPLISQATLIFNQLCRSIADNEIGDYIDDISEESLLKFAISPWPIHYSLSTAIVSLYWFSNHLYQNYQIVSDRVYTILIPPSRESFEYAFNMDEFIVVIWLGFAIITLPLILYEPDSILGEYLRRRLAQVLSLAAILFCLVGWFWLLPDGLISVQTTV